ncbi:MAG: ribonuclease Z [Cyclobacteriaceae bacterium]|nr:ribonuclease Z [Cyclobacteriaceae bacterium]
MSLKLTILGSSGALPAYGRFTTSQYLIVQNRHFLIDCGEGAQSQLMRYSLGIHKINHIFISHLHGDHYLGLTGLLFSMHLQRRESDLHLYAFRGLDEILRAQFKHSSSSLHYKIIFHPLNEGIAEILYEDDTVTIESIPLDHRIKTSGFLFREKTKSLRLDKTKLNEGILLQHIVKLKEGHDVLDDNGNVLLRASDFTLPAKTSYSYAYCSDTQPSERITAQIKDVDILYHEATFLEEEKQKARETFHSTAAEAATVALQAGAKKLIIGHFSARYKDLDLVLQEAMQIFPNTSLGIEGETFELTD